MILETERLLIKKIEIEDAPFYYELFNDKDWIQFISNKNLKSIEQTKLYLQNDFIPTLCTNELGSFTVFDKITNEAIGTTSIVKRDFLDTIDIGYGFLPKGRGKGFAAEATKRIVQYAQENLKLTKVMAYTKPTNKNSQKLLCKLGFQDKGLKPVFTKDNDAVFELIF